METQSTDRLLKVIIALMIRQDESNFTLQGQIELLNSLGLKTLEIAQILNKSSNHISKELSIINAQKDKGDKKNGKTKPRTN